MGLSHGELSALIGTIYDAGLDATGAGWPAVLDRFSHLLGGGAPACLTLERRSFSYARVLSAGIDAAAVDRYTSYYAHTDPIVIPSLARSAPGALFVGSAIASAAQLRRTEFYADFARPHDMFDCAAAVVLREGSASASLFITRAHRARVFGREPLALLTLLLPHVARAAQTALALAGLSAERDAAIHAVDELAVDALSAGVLLTDAAGCVRYANRLAETLLTANDGLGVETSAVDHRPARLQAATPDATVVLRERIAEAAVARGARRGAERHPVGSRLVLARPSGRDPLSLTVVPLPRVSAARAPWQGIATRAAVVIIVTDRDTRPDAAGVRGVIAERAGALNGRRAAHHPVAREGLTGREREVAALLAARRTNDEIATALGVSSHTARHHTERVLAKLGLTSRRALAAE